MLPVRSMDREMLSKPLISPSTNLAVFVWQPAAVWMSQKNESPRQGSIYVASNSC